jgi:hypothetical protein
MVLCKDKEHIADGSSDYSYLVVCLAMSTE